MEVFCIFPSCSLPAVQFFLLPTHKQPLCRLHSQVLYPSYDTTPKVSKAIDEWSRILTKSELFSKSRVEATNAFLSTQNVVDSALESLETVLKLAKQEITKLKEALADQRKAEVKRANSLCRRLTSIRPLASSEMRVLISCKCAEITSISKTFRFELFRIDGIWEEIEMSIANIRQVLSDYVLSDVVELSPLSSAVVLCQDLFRVFLPCVIDSSAYILMRPWRRVDIDAIKKFNIVSELSRSLAHCLALSPILAELTRMKGIVDAKRNDIGPDQLFPILPICKQFVSQLSSVSGPRFHLRNHKSKISLEDVLLFKANKTRAKIINRIGTGARTNDVEDVSELVQYAGEKNAAAVVSHGNGDFSGALSLLFRAVSIRKNLSDGKPSLKKLYANVSGVYQAKGKHHKAALYLLKKVERVPNIDYPTPKHTDLIHKLAVNFCLAEDWKEAETWMVKAVDMAKSLQPPHYQAQFITLESYSDLCVKLDRFEQALELLGKGLELCMTVGAAQGTYSSACAKFAYILIVLQRFEEAETLLSEARLADSKGFVYMVTKTRFMCRLHRLPEARNSILPLLKSQPKNCIIYNLAAQIEILAEHFAEAERLLKQGWKLSKTESNCMKIAIACCIARLHIEKREFTLAEEWISASFSLENRDFHSNLYISDLFLLQSEVLISKEQYVEAEEALKKALNHRKQVFPIHAKIGVIYQALGSLYIFLGRLNESEDCLRQGLAMQEPALPRHPDTAETYETLGRLCLARNQPQAAVDWLLKAVSIEEEFRPNHKKAADAYHSLASVLSILSEVERAETYFRKAIEIRESNPHANEYIWMSYMNLGDLLKSSNRLDEAQDFYKRAELASKE